MAITDTNYHFSNYVRENFESLDDEKLREEFAQYYGDQPVRSGFVNAYEVTLGYGGPEEGGWWYDIRTPLASVPVNSYEQALQARDHLLEYFSEFKDTPESYSVASNAGDLYIVFESSFAEAEPSTKPHYE